MKFEFNSTKVNDSSTIFNDVSSKESVHRRRKAGSGGDSEENLEEKCGQVSSSGRKTCENDFL